MRKYEDIDQKIAKLLSGNATKEDELIIISWLKESDENNYKFIRLKEFWSERSRDIKLISHESKKAQIWQAYQNEIKQNRLIKLWLRSSFILNLAALFIVLIIPSILFINNIRESDYKDDLSAVNIIIKQNPAGQKSQFQLPDGSMVWLNAESTLSYNENFSDSIRFVKLIGEAFFEVKKDASRPFHVESKDLKVSVLGTEFNMSAYNNDTDITVALIKGAVKVTANNNGKEEIILSPGYAIVYQTEYKSHETFPISKDPLFYQKYVSWKFGHLVFDGQNFEEFIKKIKRWYGVEVSIIGTPPKNWKIRASFENEYLTNVLDAISFNKDFKYNLNNKNLELFFN